MNTMQEEVEQHGPVGIGKVIVDMEKESMEGVFEDGPDDIANEEADHCRSKRRCGRYREGGEGWRHSEEVTGGDRPGHQFCVQSIEKRD